MHSSLAQPLTPPRHFRFPSSEERSPENNLRTQKVGVGGDGVGGAEYELLSFAAGIANVVINRPPPTPTYASRRRHPHAALPQTPDSLRANNRLMTPNSLGCCAKPKESRIQLAGVNSFQESIVHLCKMLLNNEVMLGEYQGIYRGDINSDFKGSVCLVLEFALPPSSPPLPSVVELSKPNMH